jgi:pimeloyl-ACP methyl ester carboxylesterase
MKLLLKTLFGLLISIGMLLLVVLVLFGHRDITLEELKKKYASSDSKFISIQEMNVHYKDEGAKSDTVPLVLIHGTGSSLHTYDAWAEQLMSERRVVRMDLPGYGLTGPFPSGNYSITHYVDFLEKFLSDLQIRKCTLVGNSLGGRIAWSFTLEYPEMVDQLILIDAAGYTGKSKSMPLAFKLAKIPVLKNILTFITPRSIARSSVENVYADKSKVTNELADRYFELTLREGNRQAFIDRFSVSSDTTAFREIKSIQQPTLILWGEEDNLIPVEMAYRFHNDLPNSTMVILKNTGHVPMEESPNESLEAVKQFLTDQEMKSTFIR